MDISLVADKEGKAWVGFTASTGGGWERHDILSWSFNTTDVSSAMVSSNISFYMDKCLPGRNLCTPDRAIVEEPEPGYFHVVLPANLKWGASIPIPAKGQFEIDAPRGTVCWDLAARGAEGCSGPYGNEKLPGPLDDTHPAGSLIVKTERSRIFFSVNDSHFEDNEGYFEFDVRVRQD